MQTYRSRTFVQPCFNRKHAVIELLIPAIGSLSRIGLKQDNPLRIMIGLQEHMIFSVFHIDGRIYNAGILFLIKQFGIGESTEILSSGKPYPHISKIIHCMAG